MTVNYFTKMNEYKNEYYNSVMNAFRSNNEIIENLYINNDTKDFIAYNNKENTSYLGSIISNGVIYLKKKKTSDKMLISPVSIIGRNIYGCDFIINNLMHDDATEIYGLLYNANNNTELCDLLDKISMNYPVSYKNKKYKDIDKITNINVYVKKVS